MSAIWFVLVQVGIIKKAKDFYSDENTVKITLLFLCLGV